MSFSDTVLITAACTGAVLFACFLGGGFCCGFVMLGRLLVTMLRRLPWQPSLLVYGLGILSCIPAYAANYAGAATAALLLRSVQHLHPALPAAVSSSLGFAFFVLPLTCNWIAWTLYRLETPAPPAPAAAHHPPSETVWPPPPAASKEPEEPAAEGRRRRRLKRGWFVD